MTLEETIRQAMLSDGVQAVNLFRNPDGGFQANIGYRDTGSSKIIRNDDPARALAAALATRKKTVTYDFEDLLG